METGEEPAWERCGTTWERCGTAWERCGTSLSGAGRFYQPATVVWVVCKVVKNLQIVFSYHKVYAVLPSFGSRERASLQESGECPTQHVTV